MAESNAIIASLKERLAEAEALCGRLTESANSADAKTAEITAVATAALAAKTQITDDQAVIATKSAHIQAAQTHADAVRAELDRLQISAAQQATEAEGQRQRSQSATESATELVAQIRAIKGSVDADAASIESSREQSESATATSKSLADKAESVEKRIASFEKSLSDLVDQAKAQLNTITGLLPGATAAGLAHAFDDRRKTFLKPATRWQWLFVGSVTCIVVLALTGLWHVYGAAVPITWDELARLWIARLPIVVALVWLALHASRESALAKRLEEDYGYKAAIAASFQGFQKQMSEIGSAAPEGSPLSQLCVDTLATISSPPGRIYEKHQLTVTPAGELVAAATQAVGPAKATK